MFYTAGIDVGSNSIKTVIMSFTKDGQNEKLVEYDLRKIRKRDTKELIRNSYEHVIRKAGIKNEEILYISSTGEGEMVDFRTGHFYSMTCHARGALFLNPLVRTVIDAGALHSKAIKMDSRSKVLSYKMTSQCASGSGQFLENISRYLGIPLDDIGKLSLTADNPEMVSSICAVLAETDVINMVSRGITPSNILAGIHISIGSRLINLLRALPAISPIMITGGLANNIGFVNTMKKLVDKEEMKLEFHAHELSIFAGAIGASIWGGFRQQKVSDKKCVQKVPTLCNKKC